MQLFLMVRRKGHENVDESIYGNEKPLPEKTAADSVSKSGSPNVTTATS